MDTAHTECPQLIEPHFLLWLRHKFDEYQYTDVHEWFCARCGHACRMRVYSFRALKAHLVEHHGDDKSAPGDHRLRAAFRQFITDINGGFRVPITLGRTARGERRKKGSWKISAAILQALQLASQQTGLPQSHIIERALSLFFELEEAIDDAVRETH